MFVTRDVVLVGAIPPPPGVTANFVNPEYIGNRIIISNIIFLLLATVVVGLRIYSRLCIIRNVGIEDFSAIIGWALSVAFSAVCIILCKYGLGVHMWNVPLTVFSPFYQKVRLTNQLHIIGIQYWIILLCGILSVKVLTLTLRQIDLISAIIYCLCILFIKLSILQLYLRISPDGKFRSLVYLVIVIVVGYNLGSAFANLFGCNPIERAWDVSIVVGSCINRPLFYFANAGLNIGTDLVMIFLPIPMLRKLHLPMKQKAGLIGVFMAGSIVCIASIIRLRYLFFLLSNPDTTYIVVPALVWSSIEINIGIICACLPTLKPVLRRHLPTLLGSSAAISNGPSQSIRRHTLDHQPDFELGEVPINKEKFRKNLFRPTKYNSDLRTESQEKIIVVKCHETVEVVEVS